MPGTDGEIRIPVGITGFVRWEVDENPGFIDIDDDDAFVPFKNSNQWVRIGGPDRYAANVTTGLGTVKILMPSFGPGRVNIDGDIYIRSPEDTSRPVWIVNLNPGNMVGDMDSGGFISLSSASVGGGGRPISWELIGDPNSFPPGMEFDPGSNRTTIITSLPPRTVGGVQIPGGPLIDGEFTFTLGINLPGSMQLQITETMIIDPIPGIMLGDVNGDGQRNLADLVMLAKFVRGEIATMPNQEAGNIVSRAPDRPNLSDLDILALFFARPAASLPSPPPPSPGPSPSPAP